MKGRASWVALARGYACEEGVKAARPLPAAVACGCGLPCRGVSKTHPCQTHTHTHPRAHSRACACHTYARRYTAYLYRDPYNWAGLETAAGADEWRRLEAQQQQLAGGGSVMAGGGSVMMSDQGERDREGGEAAALAEEPEPTLTCVRGGRAVTLCTPLTLLERLRLCCHTSRRCMWSLKEHLPPAVDQELTAATTDFLYLPWRAARCRASGVSCRAIYIRSYALRMVLDVCSCPEGPRGGMC
jgi:hypothetical protein